MKFAEKKFQTDFENCYIIEGRIFYFGDSFWMKFFSADPSIFYEMEDQVISKVSVYYKSSIATLYFLCYF